MTSHRRATAMSGEEGSALIIALVFITTIALIVSAILSFTDVGLRASKSYNFKARAKSSYAAEGGIATAIQRYSSAKGSCDDFTSPLVTEQAGPAPINGQGTIIRCQGPPPGGARATQPVNSLLSLGTSTVPADPDGITSTGELRLQGGDVFSKTTVSTTATMVVQGEVSALKECRGPIQTSRLRCANSNPADPADRSRGRDPDYTPATTVVPLRQIVPAPVPGCGGGWLIPIQPGYYDDAAAFTALTGAGSCNDKVVWFKPGTYYLDFTFRGGPATWTVDNPSVAVVGGTPTGPAWEPVPPVDPPVLNVPGACKTDADPGPGVEVIAGGDSRLDVKRGRMELCASPSSTDPKSADQQIALFGLAKPSTGDHSLEATDIRANGFDSPLDAQTIRETPLARSVTAKLTPAEPGASLDLKVFRPSIPSDSVIDSASLLVRHQDDGDTGPKPITVTADFPGSLCGAGQAPTPPQQPNKSPGVIAEDRIDLLATCGLGGSTTSKVRRAEDLAGLSVTYSVQLAPGAAPVVPAVLQVDGLVVEVTYSTPVTRRPAAASATPGFTDPSLALEIDGRTADAALSPGGSESITLAGLGDPPLPGSATIDSAVLRVAHSEGTGDASVTLPFRSGMCSLPLPQRSGPVAEDRVDLKPACSPSTPITAAELRNLAPSFQASVSSGGTATTSRLDGLWLEVVSHTDNPADLPPSTNRRPERGMSTGFLPPANATAIDTLTAEATLSGTTDNAALTVDGFDEGLPLPPGSKISSARLRVAHPVNTNLASAGIATTFTGDTCLPEPIPTSDPVFDGADLALCGLNSAERLKELTATYSVARTTVLSSQVPATATEDDGFANAQAGGRAIDDGATADAKLAATPGRTTASTTLTGFDMVPPPPPAGSTLDTATLRIKHQDDGDVAAVTAEVTFNGNTCPVTPRPLTPHAGTPGEDTIPLVACGLRDPAQLTGPEGLRVTYKADLAAGDPKSALDKLDGVQLVLTYRPTAKAQLDGIELAVVFQPPMFRPLCPRCELLKVGVPLTPRPDTATRFVASGTIYAPGAGVDLAMYGLDKQVMKRGLIARSINLGLHPTPQYKRPLGSIPPEIVTFTAYPDRTIIPLASASPGGFSTPPGWMGLREQPGPVTADAALSGSITSASLDLSGYRADPAFGAAIDGAVLRVRHQDLGNTVQVTVMLAGNPCLTRDLAAHPATPSDPYAEDQIDLAPCAIDSSAKVSDLSVNYTVTTAPTASMATAKLDGITLEILSEPLVRARVTFDRTRATVQLWDVLR